VKKNVTEFLKSLNESDYQGDFEDSYGARIVASTDNSVYQVIPQAILYPRVGDDINHIVKQLADNLESGLSIVARGGGTGTNGQSLNNSLILDTSRYLNKIISLDKNKQEVIVEPGVVLDQLNAYLAEHELFFPPDVSSSSRATIGGMIATDASGKGSRLYGKTSNYINMMEVVLSDGSNFKVETKNTYDLKKATANKLADQAQQKVFSVISDNSENIKQVFPKMNRGLTGYNLEHVLGENNDFNLSYLLAGSEGTLALTKRVTLRLIPKPKQRALVAVIYSNFDRTLEHIPFLLKANPTSIEVLDDKVLQLAQKDAIWQDVKESFGGVSENDEIKGLNFIEVTGESTTEIEGICETLKQIINETGEAYTVIDQIVETREAVINGLWGIRKRAVGLLGALEGERQPTAFVEDTAVPPENLPEFIKDFRSILDSHGLDYGMYGHADVGCLHVRPALNMREQSDQKLIRIITDEISDLAKKYGGLLWGEHGRGYRGEYSPQFFGEDVYPLLKEIKGVFDPNNLFNPGKLAVPSDEFSVTKIDKVPFRGSFDSQIVDNQVGNYKSALSCNGNGACFSWDHSDAMCPSYKATNDKRYSPKGRAAMLREWLRLSTIKSSKEVLNQLEEECFESLDACLSCKSCTHSCPIKVDVPEMKSHFLEKYYQNRKRSNSDLLFVRFEILASLGRIAPWLANALASTKIIDKLFGLVSLPKFDESLTAGLKQRSATFIDLNALPSFQEKAVILLPDSFNASFDSKVILASFDVITSLGYKVFIAPILKNGKALHVKGYRQEFKKVAENHVAQMEKLSRSGLPLISAEVVTRLMHTKEYCDILNYTPNYNIISVESWLIQHSKAVKLSMSKTKDRYILFPHCMEQTIDKQSSVNWQTIFNNFNIDLEVKISGCCGMSGLFGHEKKNQKLSQKIYQDSWQQNLKGETNILATGFSCRCQLHNHNKSVKHPVEILASKLVK